MAITSLDEIVDGLKKHIEKTTQVFIEKNVNSEDISVEEFDILCKYFPVLFIVKMFGGNYQILLKNYNARANVKKTEKEFLVSLPPEGQSFEPIEPSGIGGWQYADRLRMKVFRQLEGILNMGVMVAGHNQVVQAAKALLAEADKSKEDAAEVMMAYQTQILLFAEHLVELFLPALGIKFKNELHQFKDKVIEEIELKVFKKPDKELLDIWQKEITKLVRAFNLRRFELMLAETIIDNKELSDALDFSKDLVETYRKTDMVDRDSKSVTRLRTHILKRDGE